MYYLILSIVLLLCPASLNAAITYDTASQGEGTNSTSHSHTFAAGSNKIAILCMHYRESGGAASAIVTAPTVDGNDATFVAGVQQGDNVTRTELWYYLSPGTGSLTVVGTYPAATDHAVTGVMSFTGVAQTSTLNTAKTASGSTANMDVDGLASAVDEVGVFCGTPRGDSLTVSADATSPVSTERYDYDHTASTSISGVCGYTEAGAATSIDMRVDISSATNWAAAAVSMRPAVDTRRPVMPMIFGWLWEQLLPGTAYAY